MELGKLYAHMQNDEITSVSVTAHKSELQMIKDLNTKPEMFKVLEENRQYPTLCRCRKGFSEHDGIVQELRPTTDNLKVSAQLKETVNQVNMKPSKKRKSFPATI